MARVVGIDLPKNKRVDIALTYIYGIGLNRAKDIVKSLKIEENKKVKDLSNDEIQKLNDYIPKHYKVEGDLRKEVASNIKRLVDINCYRGYRHKRGLPVRGQRTRTNARTRKGPRKTIGTK
ncbi:MAG: 30S ribosomal protein S13 [Caldisericia bacterium]